MGLPIALAVAWLVAGCAELLGLDDPHLAPGAADGGSPGTPGKDASPDEGEPDAEIKCTGKQSECPDGFTCDFGYPSPGFLECRPNGSVPVGGVCKEIADCVGKSSCYDGVCRSLCTELDACAATIERQCVVEDSALRLCDTPCDPLPAGAEATCGSGKACTFAPGKDQSYTACGSRQWFGDYGNGISCTSDRQCKPGLICDTDFDKVCRAYCDRSAPACGQGLECQLKYPDFNFEIIAYGKHYGICRTPKAP